ncbi:esterase B1-like [Aricia agestis]|uniref:esterase B1-like n=1 Tax=Aricia agestis TaxID=91739 RepID=UPI001C203F70|nr:esterase B1-like [Aricia agestis]
MLVYAVILVVWMRPAVGEGTLVVHAPAGSIRGVPAPDGDYVMFLGIPYARVNASNPFGAAIPHEKFDKVFDASEESPVCPQLKEEFNLKKKRKSAYDGTLDCLRLNIFVPKSETKNKAAYIYVYGGMFKYGHSLMEIYGPKYLVRHDIIMVTFNFRSGPYGFMCTDIPEIPGNQGLRDQYAAIEWVRDNIRAFGGDPQKLTLGGHSSGSILVDTHLLTDRPRLFQQAILQSGSNMYPGFLHRSDPTRLLSIASDLGFETNDTSSALSFLASASPKSVIEASEKGSDLLDIVHRFYVDDADREIDKYAIIDMISDYSHLYPMQRQMIKYAKHRNTSVYLYLFSYSGHLNRMKNALNITEGGAAHSDELGYMFTMDFIPDTTYRAEQLMIDRMTTLWANFVKYGNPTPVKSELLPVSWPPLTADSVPCLQIDTNMTVISRPFRRRMAFWDLLFDAHLDEILMARA